MLLPSDAEVLAQFDRLNVWHSTGQRAPHKPLLLLIALAQLQREEGRFIAFRSIEHTLERLLRDFGPPRKSYHPEYPFWRLQNDGLWEVLNSAMLIRLRGDRKHQGDIPRAILREQNAIAAIPEDIALALSASPTLLNEVVARLLEAHFPTSLHDELLDALGFRWRVMTTRFYRAPEFRELILDIYEQRCAVCGYDGALLNAFGKSVPLGIEAAHIRWHSAHGPDTADNGLALCSLHHYMLDKGAIGISPEHLVTVSSLVLGSPETLAWIQSISGKPLRQPRATNPSPSTVHVEWHSREVFRGTSPVPSQGRLRNG